MIPFKLFEAADSSQNLHLTHADEDLYERGDKGAQAAIEFVEDVITNLGKGEIKLTTKWDGAPAIFAGWDPADGKFFVGTKSVFNANPKLYKTSAEIAAAESGGKAEKLQVALQELPKVGIPKGLVLQGDMMWTSGDFKYETIDGKRYITVHPNTIVYAWEAESEIGKRIRNTQMGIVWHTQYSGKGSLQKYRARFGVDVTKLKQTRTCWMDDANFKGADVAFDQSELDQVKLHLQAAKNLVGGFDKIVTLMDSLPSSAEGAKIKTFINSKIRAGKLPNADRAYPEYIDYIKKYWDEKIISKLKTEKAIEAKKVALVQFLSEMHNIGDVVQKSFEYVAHITEAKMIIVKKLNKLEKQALFVKTKDGYKATAPEGFVAINSKKGEAVKFVDRMSFSHFNFSDEYIKGWQK